MKNAFHKQKARDDYEKAKQKVEEFDLQYPTPAHHAALVSSVLKPSGFNKCGSCSSEEVKLSDDGRFLRCQRSHKTWLTAKSFFDGVVDLRRYLLAMMLSEEGIVIPGDGFAELLDIAQSSAWKLYKKLGLLVDRDMEQNGSAVHSSEFLDIFSRRSLHTPAKAHPVAEQQEIEKEYERESTEKPKKHPEDERNSSGEGEGPGTDNNDSSVQTELLSLLSDEPIGVEELCEQTTIDFGKLSGTLVLLTLKGAVDRLPGDKYVRANRQQTNTATSVLNDERLKDTIDDFIQFVKAKFHGVSRKYIQLYLHMYNWSVNNKPSNDFSLLKLCGMSGPISNQEIACYVSPLMVQVPMPNSA